MGRGNARHAIRARQSTEAYRYWQTGRGKAYAATTSHAQEKPYSATPYPAFACTPITLLL